MMEEIFPTTPVWAPKTWLPPVDIKETEKELLFQVELPGMSRENIEVELTGDTLVIRGKREQEKLEEKEGLIRRERSYGTFQRSFRLDIPVKGDAITADYKNGVLKVCVPKLEIVKPQKITITP